MDGNGKSKAIKIAQSPSTATLRPVKEDSVNWDTTENLYIEGDNLEVLKQLQKSYFGKIKMIYIDPPYNTGGDFVYKDDFKDSIASYKEQTSQTHKSNPDTSGRYHTDWLNMLYPRLLLAKNLLKNDGLLFISIDDNEQSNLIKMGEEIFGEENFVTNIVWTNKEGGGGSDSKLFKSKHEYICVFSKNKSEVNINGVVQEEDSSYNYSDKYIGSRGKYKLIKLNSFSIQYSKSLDYEIEGSQGNIIIPSENGKRGCWRWSKEKYLWGIKSDFIVIKDGQDGLEKVYTKQYFKVDNECSSIIRSLPPKALIDRYSSTLATKQLEKLFSKKIFNYSKPVDLIKDLIQYTVKKEDIILDFFSGSATTAHAVLNLNLEDNGNRKFVMVQLPEITAEKSVEFRSGYKNICEIGKDRIARYGKQIIENNSIQNKNTNFDFGFKVFRLDETNIKEWDSSQEVNENTLFDHLELIKGDRTKEDVLYEILLKYGVFNQKVKTISIDDRYVYDVSNGYMIVDLNDNVTEDDIKKIIELKPQVVVFMESSFGNDNDKLNAEYTLKRNGVKDIKCI